MPSGREAAHVAANLGKDDASAQFVDPGDGGQQVDGRAKGLDMSVNLLIDGVDRCVDGVDLLQLQAQQEAVMPRDAAAQRLAELLGRRLDPTMRQLGQLLGIAFTGDQGFDHPAAGQAHHIGDDRVELDVGIFECLLQPLDMAAGLPHQLLAGAQQSLPRRRPGSRISWVC